MDLETLKPTDLLNSNALHWCVNIGSKATTVKEAKKDNSVCE